MRTLPRAAHPSLSFCPQRRQMWWVHTAPLPCYPHAATLLWRGRGSPERTVRARSPRVLLNKACLGWLVLLMSPLMSLWATVSWRTEASASYCLASLPCHQPCCSQRALLFLKIYLRERERVSEQGQQGRRESARERIQADSPPSTEPAWSLISQPRHQERDASPTEPPGRPQRGLHESRNSNLKPLDISPLPLV